jgi:hypothetical protein
LLPATRTHFFAKAEKLSVEFIEALKPEK